MWQTLDKLVLVTILAFFCLGLWESSTKSMDGSPFYEQWASDPAKYSTDFLIRSIAWDAITPTYKAGVIPAALRNQSIPVLPAVIDAAESYQKLYFPSGNLPYFSIWDMVGFLVSGLITLIIVKWKDWNIFHALFIFFIIMFLTFPFFKWLWLNVYQDFESRLFGISKEEAYQTWLDVGEKSGENLIMFYLLNTLSGYTLVRKRNLWWRSV